MSQAATAPASAHRSAFTRIVTGLEPALLERVLSRALRRGGDYADVFFENRITRSLQMVDGHAGHATVAVSRGVGIRVLSGDATGFAYSSDVDEASLLAAADAASLIANDGRSHTVALGGAAPRPDAQPQTDPARYAELLARADAHARAADPRVARVQCTLVDQLQHVQIASSDGTIAADRRPLVTFAVQVTARDGSHRATGQAIDGGRAGLDVFERRTPEAIAATAVRIATVNLVAREAPSGQMPVVIAAGGGGVLLHEAVGHGLEADFNRRGTSLYSGRLGARVAGELVTIYDDGSLAEERGSMGVDDEGLAAERKTLIEGGVLRGYLADRLNARLMGIRGGRGRRESYRALPIPRMCNTFMANGPSTPDEIIRSVERGIYAVSFAGGQVEIGKGDFVFMVAEGYLIEHGRITAPIRGATLSGNGPDIMDKIALVGNDARFAERGLDCGKLGQHVPVGVGTPTLKLTTCTVGGTGRG